MGFDENNAVSWSEWESTKLNIVFETRIQVIRELNAAVEQAQDAEKSPEYISALKDAVEVVMSYGNRNPVTCS